MTDRILVIESAGHSATSIANQLRGEGFEVQEPGPPRANQPPPPRPDLVVVAVPESTTGLLDIVSGATHAGDVDRIPLLLMGSDGAWPPELSGHAGAELPLNCGKKILVAVVRLILRQDRERRALARALETTHSCFEKLRVVSNRLTVLIGFAQVCLEKLPPDSPWQSQHSELSRDVHGVPRMLADLERLLETAAEPHADATAPASNPGLGSALGPGGSEHILLVDDDRGVREFTSEVLRISGYQLTTASSGEEALRICEGQGGAFDIIVTDVVMPGMSGVTLARTLAKKFPQLKILLVSAFAADLEGVRQRGGAEFPMISKPFETGKFMQKLRELLDGPR